MAAELHQWEVWQGDKWEPATSDEAVAHIRSYIGSKGTMPERAFWLPWSQVTTSVNTDVAHGDILVHHKGADYFYGRDSAGHDVEYHRKTGRVQRIYTNAQRQEAIDRHAAGESYAAVALVMSVPVQCVKNWYARRDS